MKTRRQFIKLILGFSSGMGLVFSPIANGIQVVFAKAKKMNTIEKFCAGLLPILFLLALPLVDGYRPAHAENPELSTAVFYVQ